MYLYIIEMMEESRRRRTCVGLSSTNNNLFVYTDGCAAAATGESLALYAGLPVTGLVLLAILITVVVLLRRQIARSSDRMLIYVNSNNLCTVSIDGLFRMTASSWIGTIIVTVIQYSMYIDNIIMTTEIVILSLIKMF